MRSQLYFLALAVATIYPAVVPGVAQAKTHEVSFNHVTDIPREYSRKLKAGDELRVTIQDTCRDKFTYEYLGVVPEDAEEARNNQRASDADINKLKAMFGVDCVIEQGSDQNEQTIDITHKEKFRGYVIEIRRSADVTALVLGSSQLSSFVSDLATHCSGVAPPACKVSLSSNGGADVKSVLTAEADYKKTLDSVSFVVEVPKSGWEYELAGGFTVSDLTDEKYALISQGEGDDQVQVVIRERDVEDDQELGLAGLIHLSHSNWNWGAISVGLGINETSEASYFFGPSWRLGGKGFITLGYNYGSIKTRPSGVRVSPDPRDSSVSAEDLFAVTDANVLNNLGSKNRSAFFLSLSYSFLSPGEAFFSKKLATSDDTKKDGAKKK